jgi:hypothetical protein
MSDFRCDQTRVRHQGDRPTCVAFAISAAHEWTAGDGVIRSTEDAMWAAHQVGTVPGREEVSVAWALGGLDQHGHACESAWPYGTPCWIAGRPAAAHDAANRRALPPFQLLPDSRFDRVAAEIADRRPVVLTVRVVRAAWRQPDGTIDAESNRKTPGNHAVLAVGALTSPERIIVKNSWGPRWGDDGYGYLTRQYLDHYGLRAHVLERT